MNPMKDCSTCGKDQVSEVLASGGQKAQYFHYSTPITAIGAGLTQNFSIPIYPDSYFVIKKLTSTQTAPFGVRLVNGATGRFFSNDRINNANVMGTIQLPNRLSDPVVVPPSSNLQVEITDLSGAPNTVQAALIGFRVFNLQNPPTPTKDGALLSWFQYAVPVALAGSDIQVATLRIEADSDFLVRKLVSTQDGAYTLKVSDSGSKDYWFDNEQTNGNVAGTAQYPNFLARPRLVVKNSTISVEVRDLSAGANNVQLVFEGAKIYR